MQDSSENSSFHSNHINKTFNTPTHYLQQYYLDIHNYLLQLSKYAGETGRNLKTLITEHLRNIHKNTNTVINLHFNTTSHTIEHMEVNNIEKLYKSSNYRKAKELF